MNKYAEWYTSISEPFRGPLASKAIGLLDRLLVVVIACAYLIMLGWLVFNGDVRAWRFALVPAITFVLVTVVRAVLDRPRPYEAYPIDPIIVKSTLGKSMPSRHLSSAVIIACALAWVDMRLGIPAFVACAIVAATRIIGGVHFPRDVAVAAAISLACGIVGFLFIP